MAEKILWVISITFGSSICFSMHNFADVNNFFSEFLVDEALNFKRYCNEAQLQH